MKKRDRQETLARKLALEYVNGFRAQAGKPLAKSIGGLWWDIHGGEFMLKALKQEAEDCMETLRATETPITPENIVAGLEASGIVTTEAMVKKVLS